MASERALNPERYQGLGFAAGVIAALVFLVVVAVVRLVSRVPSFAEIVADGFLLLLPGPVFSVILDTLQRAAKPLMYAGMAVGVLIVGGLLGRWYAGRPSLHRLALIAIGLWLVFGLLVYSLVGAGWFGSGLPAGAMWHGLSLLTMFAIFVLALRGAYGVLARVAESSQDANGGRRIVLQAAVLAGLALATGGVVAALRREEEQAPQGTVASAATAPPSATAASNAPPFDVPGLSSEVTRVEDFYTVSKNLFDPSVQSSGWSLRIDGLVERPLTFTYDELMKLPASDGFYTLMCISNEVGGDLIGNASWRGVKLRWLLEQAGVKAGAYDAMFTGGDDYHDSVRIDRALHPDALLAWEMNGAPLRKEHGAPARLLIPGIYGMKNVKWLTGITIMDQDFKGYWQQRGWDDAAPYQTMSRIDTPLPRAVLPSGKLEVAGVAFAGDRGIAKVEVSEDGGKTWREAELKDALSPYSWRLWKAELKGTPGTHQLLVRATDGEGHLQIHDADDPFPKGATGYHGITVAVT